MIVLHFPKNLNPHHSFASCVFFRCNHNRCLLIDVLIKEDLNFNANFLDQVTISASIASALPAEIAT